MTLSHIPIRLQVNLAGSPPAAPFDYNTGDTPQMWRGQTAALQVGLFDVQGNPLNISNIDSLQLILMASQDAQVALYTATVDQVDLLSEVSAAAWQNGTQCNAQFDLPAAATDQSLSGGTSQNYWVVVQGVIGGIPLIYGAGPLVIVNPGSVLPAQTPTLGVSRHAQTTSVGNITVTPNSQLHKEIVTVGGTARTSNIMLGTIGMIDGAELTVILVLPATAAIILNLRSSLVTNPVIATITTGVVLQCRLKFYFDANTGAWVPEIFNSPSP